MSSPFPHTEISLQIILALGVGLLVGLEREFASKDVGVRTFSLISLFGLVSQLVSSSFVLGGFVGILCITVYINVRAMWVNRSLEVTTSVAMLIVYGLGVLVAEGHIFTPVAAALLMTMLLAWKSELAAFAHGLKLEEIRSVVTLGLLSFVIYPILPDRYVDPWRLFNPNDAWVTVIALAAISFVNYVLLRAYSTKGLYYSALLGGAVNSSAAVTELSSALKLRKGIAASHAVPILLMTVLSMLIRNLAVLGIFEPDAIVIALVPLAGMAASAGGFIWKAVRRKEEGLSPTSPLQLSSPVSLRRVLKFGIVFVLLQASGSLAQRYLGSFGVLAISLLGGLVSSASATAAAARLAAHGDITPVIAGVATILTSISSAFVNLPLVYQVTKDKDLTRKLFLATLASILVGLLLMAVVFKLQHEI